MQTTKEIVTVITLKKADNVLDSSVSFNNRIIKDKIKHGNLITYVLREKILSDYLSNNDQRVIAYRILEVLENYKQLKKSGINLDTDCALIFNDQGLLLDTKHGTKLLDRNCPNHTNGSQLYIDNFHLVNKVYQLLNKDNATVSINFDENFKIILKAGNSLYKFIFAITDQYEYDLPDNENLNRYEKYFKYPDHPLEIDLDSENSQKLALGLALQIKNLNTRAKRKVLGAKARKNTFYITNQGAYLESNTKKETLIFQIWEKASLDILGGVSMSMSNIDDFYNKILPYWISEDQTITYQIIRDDNYHMAHGQQRFYTYRLQAIKDGQVITRIDLNNYTGYSNGNTVDIVTRWLEQEEDKNNIKLSAA